MNIEDTKKAIEKMQAFVDGKEIQRRPRYIRDGKVYTLDSNPEWNWTDYDYRVKPEPITCWITILNDRLASTVHSTEEEARDCVHPELNTEWSVRKVVIE